MIHIVSLKVLHGLRHILFDCLTFLLRFNCFLQSAHMQKNALENSRATPLGSSSFTKTRLQNNTDNSHQREKQPHDLNRSNH